MRRSPARPWTGRCRASAARRAPPASGRAAAPAGAGRRPARGRARGPWRRARARAPPASVTTASTATSTTAASASGRPRRRRQRLGAERRVASLRGDGRQRRPTRSQQMAARGHAAAAGKGRISETFICRPEKSTEYSSGSRRNLDRGPTAAANAQVLARQRGDGDARAAARRRPDLVVRTRLGCEVGSGFGRHGATRARRAATLLERFPLSGLSRATSHTRPMGLCVGFWAWLARCSPPLPWSARSPWQDLPPRLPRAGRACTRRFRRERAPIAARAFFGDLLPTSVSADALSDGVVLPAGRALRAAPPAPPEPSRRAGLDGNPDGGTGWLVGALLAVLAAVGLVALVLRGRPSEAL